MGTIYLITNKINGKRYVGQTRTALKVRMSKHYSDAKCEPGVTGIDAAIRKYGQENFDVRVLCECPEDQLDRLERYYIEVYNTYNSNYGYNLTPGGQGAGAFLNLNSQEVIDKYHELKTIKATCEYFHCCDKVISDILHNNNVELYKQPGRVENILNKGKPFQIGEGIKPVRIIELKKDFPSLKECAQWLIDNGYSKASSMEMARKSLSRCLTGERKTYCKLHFIYI